MKAIINTELNIPSEDAWFLVKQSKTLIYVCKGLLAFNGSNSFPEQWREGAIIHTRLLFFGVIPAWQHSLRFESISNELKIILTQEKGGLVQSWNHEIKVEEKSSTSCIYTDTVDIKAGLFTPLVWLFASFLYRYRQRRWKLLPHKST